jgi:hypothetical protein
MTTIGCRPAHTETTTYETDSVVLDIKENVEEASSLLISKLVD